MKLPVLLVLCLCSSLALAQVDTTTGTSTDDATMARLRVGHLVHGGPNIDLLVNGRIPMNRDVAQANFASGFIGGYLYLEPGSYSVAIVPTGKGLAEALIGPIDLALQAGHRYTLAMMGQMDDAILTPLVVDDTALLLEARTSPDQGIMILVNNLGGSETLDFTLGGEGPSGVPYGGAGAAALAMPFGKPLRIVSNVGVIDVYAAGGYQDPGIDFTVSFIGRVSGGAFRDTQSGNTSDLTILEFLRTFSGLGFEWDGHPISFDTFLDALDSTGLGEMLATDGPYLVIPPTDEAFASLPKDEFDALMADPQALADLLRHHIVEGYYPRGALTGVGGQAKVLTNALGLELAFLPSRINGTNVSNLQFYMVANGNRIAPITTVLRPAGD
jgi:hypothetical protein